MANYEWLEACRERGRRGGLKSARVRREKADETNRSRHEASSLFRKLKREQEQEEYCACCEQRLHNGVCPRCDTY